MYLSSFSKNGLFWEKPIYRKLVILLTTVICILGCKEKEAPQVPPEYYRLEDIYYSPNGQNAFWAAFHFPDDVPPEEVYLLVNGVYIIPTHEKIYDDTWLYLMLIKGDTTNVSIEIKDQPSLDVTIRSLQADDPPSALKDWTLMVEREMDGGPLILKHSTHDPPNI